MPVLYEMLTGHAAFAGETVSDTIAAILGREPAWGALPDATPANAQRLLQRCLEKDPKRACVISETCASNSTMRLRGNSLARAPRQQRPDFLDGGGGN